MPFALAVTFVVGAVLQNPQPTLAGELLRRDLPAPADAAALDRPITSYSIHDDPSRFLIGYYEAGPDNLRHDLRVRSFDKRTRAWRSASFESIGSVLSIERHQGLIYLKGHNSPSDAPLLVLTDDLRQRRLLDGWPMAFLPDGRVVFHRSMRHFAPTHAGVLAVYDPIADTEQTFYPSAQIHNDRGGERVPGSDLVVDRSIGSVNAGPNGATIAFVVDRQLRRLTNAGSEDAGPNRRYSVTCDMRQTPPSCRETRIEPSRR